MGKKDNSMHLSDKKEEEKEEIPIPNRSIFSSEEDVYEKWKEGLVANKENVNSENEPSGNALPHIEKD